MKVQTVTLDDVKGIKVGDELVVMKVKAAWYIKLLYIIFRIPYPKTEHLIVIDVNKGKRTVTVRSDYR